LIWSIIVPAAAGTFSSGNNFVIEFWQTSEGLPEHSITAVVQTSDGYLWLGTFGGLVRFDGSKFTSFTPAQFPALPSPSIVNLYSEKSGRFWISTTRGLISRLGNNVISYGPSQGWTGNYVRTFSEQGGVVAVTSFDGKVARAEGGVLQPLPEPPGEKGAGYFGYVDPHGEVWVAQDHYFGRWHAGSWEHSDREGLITNKFSAAATARDGSLLVLSGAGLLRIREGRLESQMTLA